MLTKAQFADLENARLNAKAADDDRASHPENPELERIYWQRLAEYRKLWRTAENREV